MSGSDEVRSESTILGGFLKIMFDFKAESFLLNGSFVVDRMQKKILKWNKLSSDFFKDIYFYAFY